jgi:hypothetical protein
MTLIIFKHLYGYKDSSEARIQKSSNGVRTRLSAAHKFLRPERSEDVKISHTVDNVNA